MPYIYAGLSQHVRAAAAFLTRATHESKSFIEWCALLYKRSLTALCVTLLIYSSSFFSFLSSFCFFHLCLFLVLLNLHISVIISSFMYNNIAFLPNKSTFNWVTIVISSERRKEDEENILTFIHHVRASRYLNLFLFCNTLTYIQLILLLL